MFHRINVFIHCFFCNQFAECQRKFRPNKYTVIYRDREKTTVSKANECVQPMEDEQ